LERSTNNHILNDLQHGYKYHPNPTKPINKFLSH